MPVSIRDEVNRAGIDMESDYWIQNRLMVAAKISVKKLQ